MKELSIEEKAKRYDETIEIAKKINNEHKAQPFDVMLKVFPELKESEDDRVKNEIISAIKEDWPGHTDWIDWLEKQGEQKPFISYDALREGIAYFGITQYQIDNWLKKYVDVEKQGEQKPAEYNRETSIDLRDIVDNEANAIWEEESTDGCHLVIDSFNMFYGICMQIAEAVVDYKKPAWSEEDEKMLDDAIGAIGAADYYTYDDKQEIENWLKSLRPQNTWKPSEEQFNNTSCTHLSKEEAESKVWKQ